jgi:hypothetical protein
MKKLLPVLAVSLMVLGCASEQPVAKTATTPDPLQVKKEQIRMTLNGIPKWYVSPPREIDTYFATATSTSDDMQLAVDKAMLIAKRTLVDRIDGILSSKTKTVVTETKGKSTSSLTRTTTNEVRDGDSSRYSVRDVVVQQSSDQYRAYVLLEFYPG